MGKLWHFGKISLDIGMQILEKHKAHFIVLFIALWSNQNIFRFDFWSFIYNIFCKIFNDVMIAVGHYELRLRMEPGLCQNKPLLKTKTSQTKAPWVQITSPTVWLMPFVGRCVLWPIIPGSLDVTPNIYSQQHQVFLHPSLFLLSEPPLAGSGVSSVAFLM